MWFGHGTGSGKLKGQASGPVSGAGKDDPILALAFGAVAALAPAQRGRAEAQFQGTNLSRFRDAMTAWMRGVRMDSASFADWFFGRDGNDPVAQILHRAARDAGLAKSPAEFAQAARGVADAMKAVGLDRWARFIADAQARARDPATVAAIETSVRPPDPARDAIRPVYPVETALAIGAAGIAEGAVAALRAAGGAILRQILPDGRPAAGESAARSAEKPGNTAQANTSSSTTARKSPVSANRTSPASEPAAPGSPAAQSAASVRDKLNRYTLNLEHRRGGSKARWFQQALGFTRDNSEELARQLVFDEGAAVQTEVTEVGVKYNQTIDVIGANGRTIPVRTAWIKGKGGVVRLITALPGK